MRYKVYLIYDPQGVIVISKNSENFEIMTERENGEEDKALS